LLEATLYPGDVMFVPARFPHTTDTLSCYDDDDDGVDGVDEEDHDCSIHLTVGLDTHVWSMNYLSMRRLGLLKFGKLDVLSGTNNNNNGNGNANYNDDYENDTCVGAVNHLSKELREHLFSSVDGRLLSVNDDLEPLKLRASIIKVAADLHLLIAQVDGGTGTGAGASTLSLDECVAVVAQFQAVGQKILNVHTAMYVSAMEEEMQRMIELEQWKADENMTKQQSDRLSIFRVPIFFEQLDGFRDELRAWATEGNGRKVEGPVLHSLLDGDQIEVNLDLGVASWFPAKIVNVRADDLFDIQMFDGEVKNGIRREAMKGPHGIGIFI